MNDQRLRLRVENARSTGRVLTFDLVSPEGHALPQVAAGAHVDVHLSEALTRPYSLCGDPDDRSRYSFGVLREASSRGGSVAVHERVRDGADIEIGLPRNMFPLSPAGGESILIGAGIGITPLIAMAHTLHRAGTSFRLFYIARSEDAAFAPVLREAPFSTSVHICLRDDPTAARFDPVSAFADVSKHAHVYTCGPSAFMEAVRDAAMSCGIAASAIRHEGFSAKPVTPGDGFDVVAVRSGINVAVGSEESIVQALAKAGIRVKVSCEQGICGTCIAPVVEGVPDHRDEYLTEEERAANDQIALCCSRARTRRLVIDL